MTPMSAASQTRDDRGQQFSLFQPGRQLRKRAGLVPMAWRSPPRRSLAPVTTMNPPRTRVLLITDRASVALDLQRALREAGYQIVGPASSVEQASRLLARFAIDCAIVDLDSISPQASAAAELLDHWGTPCVILTSRMDPPEAYAGRPRLHAPFDKQDVVSAIERAITRYSDDADIQYRLEPSIGSWPRVMPEL